MNIFIFILATLAGVAIIKIHERNFKQIIDKRLVFIVALLLGFAISYGGTKGEGGGEEPPEPPTPPEEPEYPVVENVRLKLIGRVENGKFIPLTSEWLEVQSTNGVINAEQFKEIVNE